MFTLKKEVYLPFEITTYLQRRILGQPISTSDKLFVELKKRVENSYAILEPIYLELSKKYDSLWKILEVANENDSIAHVLLSSGFHNNEKLSEPKSFEHYLYLFIIEVDAAEDIKYQLNEDQLFKLLQDSSFTDNDKWKINQLYHSFPKYNKQFKEVVKTLEPYIKKEIDTYNDLLLAFHTDWSQQLAIEKPHIYISKLLNTQFSEEQVDSMTLFPSIFGNNSLTWQNDLFFTGIIFDSKFSFHNEMNLSEMCRYLSLFSDPSRFAIVKQLLKQPMYGKELANTLQLSPATISYHISDLSSAGLIKYVSGKNKRIYYHINSDLLDEIEQGFHKHIHEVD